MYPAPPARARPAWHGRWRPSSAIRCCTRTSSFRPRSDYERQKLTGLADRVAEVYCACPPDLALRRYNERAGGRHLVHQATSLAAEAMAEWDQPVGIGPLIPVDTTVTVDVVKVAAEVRRHLGSTKLDDWR